MFERYTERARRVLFFARMTVAELGGREIGSEHLLLALVKQASGLSDEIFARADVKGDALRADVETRFPDRERIPTWREIPFSSEVKAMLEATAREADGMGHAHIGTEHLLLGVLSQPESFAGRLLGERGLDLHTVRTEISARTRSDP